MAKQCKACGKPAVVAARVTKGEETINAFLCEECVHRVAHEARVEVVASLISTMPKGYVEGPTPTQAKTKKTSKKRSPLKAILISVLVLLVLGAGVFGVVYAIKNAKNDTPETTTMSERKNSSSNLSKLEKEYSRFTFPEEKFRRLTILNYMNECSEISFRDIARVPEQYMDADNPTMIRAMGYVVSEKNSGGTFSTYTIKDKDGNTWDVLAPKSDSINVLENDEVEFFGSVWSAGRVDLTNISNNDTSESNNTIIVLVWAYVLLDYDFPEGSPALIADDEMWDRMERPSYYERLDREEKEKQQRISDFMDSSESDYDIEDICSNIEQWKGKNIYNGFYMSQSEYFPPEGERRYGCLIMQELMRNNYRWILVSPNQEFYDVLSNTDENDVFFVYGTIIGRVNDNNGINYVYVQARIMYHDNLKKDNINDRYIFLDDDALSLTD